VRSTSRTPIAVSADPANWTPHVLDGKLDAIVVVGHKVVAGGLFTKVATADDPPGPDRPQQHLRLRRHQRRRPAAVPLLHARAAWSAPRRSSPPPAAGRR
jgi:hypothetical protein